MAGACEELPLRKHALTAASEAPSGCVDCFFIQRTECRNISCRAYLGEGGMGAVYRARLNRDAAIKILPDSFASDPDRLDRFTREAQAPASLNHPIAAYPTGSRSALSSLTSSNAAVSPGQMPYRVVTRGLNLLVWQDACAKI